MKLNLKTTAVCGLLATFALTSLSPVLASPASRQNNKNQWRNLGLVGAVVAGYGLLEHNQTATVLGAAGAAYSANRYEQDRHSQSQHNNDWQQRYHRQYGNQYGNQYGGQYGSQYDSQYGDQYGNSNNSGQWQTNQRQNHDGNRDQDHGRRDRD